MIRIICNQYLDDSFIITPTSTRTQHVQRLEGGWWFSEQSLEDVERHTYHLHDRFVDTHGSIIEYVTELSEDFSETPCWLHDSLETWIRLREEESAVLWKIGSRLLLTFPIEQRWLPWMELLLGSSYKDIRAQVDSKRNEHLLRKYQIEQPFQDLIHPERLVQPMSTQKATSPLQMKTHAQSSSEIRRVVPRVIQPTVPSKSVGERVPQHPKQALASGSPKVVQTGSLCSPTFLPDLPSPRKSPSRPPNYPSHIVSKVPSVVRSSACLIDLSVS